MLKQTEQLSEAELIYTDAIDNDKKDMYSRYIYDLIQKWAIYCLLTRISINKSLLKDKI
jgi:hypothetical protein